MRPTVGVCIALAAGVGIALKIKGNKKKPVKEIDEEEVQKALECYSPEPLSYHIQVKGGEFKVVVNKRKGVITSVQLDDSFYQRKVEDAIKPNTQLRIGSPTNKGDSDLSLPYAELNKEFECVDFSSLDFLCLSTNDAVLRSAADSLGKYGPGACGPRGFYGSLDIFIDLEEKFAKYLGFPNCALYSYELLLFPSVIPTLVTKKGQVVIVPVIIHRTKSNGEVVNEYTVPVPQTIRNGCKLGYATLLEARVNIEIDLNDLSTVSVDFKNFEESCKTHPHSWVAVETGRHGMTFSVLEDVCKIAHNNRCMVCADCTYLRETYLGAGRATKIPADVVLVGLGTGFGGVGGVVLSTKEIIDRQRLGGRGYVFSAAPPPPCISGVITSLGILGEGDMPLLIKDEIRAVKVFVAAVSRSNSCFIIDYTEGSPLISVGFRREFRPNKGLRQLCEEMMTKGFLINPLNYDRREILVCVKSKMTDQQISEFVSALK